MTQPKVLRFVALILLAAAPGLYAQQQNVGNITGTVEDRSGAVIPGAQVIATNTATGVVQSTVTSSGGVYFVNLLPVGLYTFTVTKEGFQKATTSDVHVIAGQTFEVNFNLQVGPTTQTVTISAAPPLVNATDSAQGTTRTLQEIQNLPINLMGIAARAAVNVFQTMPGVNFNTLESGGQSWTIISRAQINGISASFGYEIDGLEASTGEGENAEDFIAPTPDQIEETRLTTNTDATQGFNAGTTLSLITKSGTNHFHGSVDYFNKNDALEARNFFLPVRSEDKQNEIGLTLGGPVLIPKLYNGRNKTFIFLAADFFRYITTASPPSTPTVASVPTAAERVGNFSSLLGGQIGTDALGRPVYSGEIYDPATTRQLPNGTYVRDPFMYNGQLNVVAPTEISSISSFFGGNYSLPTLSGIANNWVGPSAHTIIDKDQWSIKLDHSIGEKHRFTFSSERQMGWFDTNSLCKYGHFAEYGSNGYVDAIDAVSARETCTNMYRYRFAYSWTAAPNVVVNFRAGVTRDPHRNVIPLTAQAANAACQAGLKGTLSCRTPSISIENLSPIGPSTNYEIHSQRTPFTLNLAWSKGKHLLTFGADYVTAPFIWANLVNTYGSFSFSHLETALPGVSGTGLGYASFLVGSVNSATVTSGVSGRWATSEGALYAQDDWRITPKLTLNWGLRWELTDPSYEHDNKISGLDPSEPNPGAGNILGALSYYGTGTGRNGRTQIGSYYFKAFAPKVGLAYAVNPKTVLRASYGISYYPYWQKWVGSTGPDIAQVGFNVTENPTSTDSGITPAFNWNSGFPLVFPTLPIINPSFDNGNGIDYEDPHDNRPPMVENIGVQIEKQLPGTTLVRIGYVGTMAHRYYATYNMDQLPLQYLSLGSVLNQKFTSAAPIDGVSPPYPGYTGTVAQALTPYPQYTSVTDLDAQMGNSTYNALQVSVQRHFGSLTFLANLTVAKSLSNSDNPGFDNASAVLNAQSVQIQHTAKALEGYLPSSGSQWGDIPKQLNVSWYWDVPVGRGKHFLGGVSKPVDHALGNWRLSALQYYQSGQPINLSTNETIPALGAVWPVLNQGVPIKAVGGCGNLHPGVAGQDAYLNKAAFRDPASFALGNTFILPSTRQCGYVDEDLGLDKGFQLGEERRISFGAMITNVFNRHQFQNMVSNIDNPAFGQFTNANFPRSFQLYGKITF